MGYGDYVEQLTYLLFLKMADERTRPPMFTVQGCSGGPRAVQANSTALLKTASLALKKYT